MDTFLRRLRRALWMGGGAWLLGLMLPATAHAAWFKMHGTDTPQGTADQYCKTLAADAYAQADGANPGPPTGEGGIYNQTFGCFTPPLPGNNFPGYVGQGQIPWVWCDAPSVWDVPSQQCVAPPPDVCDDKTGNTELVNWTVGYTSHPDPDSLSESAFKASFVGPISVPPAFKTMCNQGCKVTTNGQNSQWWQSKSPTAQGLFRVAVDVTVVNSGISCSPEEQAAQDPAVKQDTRPPACNGAVGQVNGVTRCIHQSQPNEAADPLVGQQPASGNPPAGDAGNGGTTGRTPSTGNGTATGGPAAAGDGSSNGANGTGSDELPTTSDGGDVPDPEPRGECAENPSAAGCGGNPQPVGQLYEGKGKTLQTVMDGFKAQALASPIGTATGSFFTVNLAAGACPTWDLDVPFLNASYVLDWFCWPMTGTALAVMRACFLLVASFFAFRVAIDR